MQNLKKCWADFHKNVGASKPLVNLVMYFVIFFKSHHKSFLNGHFKIFATAYPRSGEGNNPEPFGVAFSLPYNLVAVKDGLLKFNMDNVR